MSQIVEIPAATVLAGTWSQSDQAEALDKLEASNALYIPGLSIKIGKDDQLLFSQDKSLTDGNQKNITLDPFLNKTSGIAKGSVYRNAVDSLMGRYRSETVVWLERLLGPQQGKKFIPQRTTFRPVEIQNRMGIGKVGSTKQFRFDDTLLHADAFKRRPMVRRRILRVFNNVNPFGESRVWKIGGDFSDYAKRYLDKIRNPFPGEFAALNILGLTHWKRSHYDHIMLALHDLGKLDKDFQQNSPQTTFEFAPNSVWLCFTDSVLHAALAGRYALEQTFEITIDDMVNPSRSPQKQLEALIGRAVC